MDIDENFFCPIVEMNILGAMFDNLFCLENGLAVLKERDFVVPEHASIFIALKLFKKIGSVPDISSIFLILKEQGLVTETLNIGFLTKVRSCGSGIDLDWYIDALKDKTEIRELSLLLKTQYIKLNSPSPKPKQVMEDIQKWIYEISSEHHKKSFVDLKKRLTGHGVEEERSYIETLEKRKDDYDKNGDLNSITGLSTGFFALDKIIDGLVESNLIILGARPGMGKTSLALNIAEHVGLDQDVPVGIFSLEMSADQLIEKIICSRAKIEASRIKKGNISEYQIRQVSQIVEKIKENKILIDDKPGLTIDSLIIRAKRMKELHNIGFLVVDYLQLLSGRKSENRQVEVSDMSRKLKLLALELSIPILCLSQLSRKIEERGKEGQPRTPRLSDLRESGSIEQDADQIIFINRPEDVDGRAYIYVEKNRHGATGSILLEFEASMTKFKNFTLPEFP